MWRDALGRILPFVVAGGIYARLSHKASPHADEAGENAIRDVLLGLAIGVPMAAMATRFRALVAPKYRLPTARDQALQTAYYFAVNAPAEEIFWRGTVQPLAIRMLSHIPGMRSAARPLGWTLTTAAFGAYHRLGHWSWRAIAGVTAAGGLFGALALMRPRRSSLLLPVLVHGFATAGFLSWGDAALDLHRRWRLWQARP
jgi:membrane protease YdiL (CAAX protease family)